MKKTCKQKKWWQIWASEKELRYRKCSKLLPKMQMRVMGKGFCLISSNEFTLNKENLEFLKSIDCNLLVLNKKIIEKSPYLKPLMEKDKVFLVRPDRYIFGSTTSKVSLDNLVENLKHTLKI